MDIVVRCFLFSVLGRVHLYAVAGCLWWWCLQFIGLLASSWLSEQNSIVTCHLSLMSWCINPDSFVLVLAYLHSFVWLVVCVLPVVMWFVCQVNLICHVSSVSIPTFLCVAYICLCSRVFSVCVVRVSSCCHSSVSVLFSSVPHSLWKLRGRTYMSYDGICTMGLEMEGGMMGDNNKSFLVTGTLGNYGLLTLLHLLCPQIPANYPKPRGNHSRVQ